MKTPHCLPSDNLLIQYLKELILAYNGDAPDYDNIEAIDAVINKNLVGWSAKRISRVSRAVLRLAVCELMFTDVPVGVAINEAVEISKK